MKKILISLLLAGLSGAAGAAELDIDQCTFVDPPTVADGQSASEEQMVASGSAVREYVGATQDALACLQEAEAGLGEDITDEQRAQLVTLYNEGVDQLNTVAEEYNKQVRAFKNR